MCELELCFSNKRSSQSGIMDLHIGQCAYFVAPSDLVCFLISKVKITVKPTFLRVVNIIWDNKLEKTCELIFYIYKILLMIKSSKLFIFLRYS